MAQVFLTGATGFIGGHLADALVRRGDTVRCLVRRSSTVDHLRTLEVELIRGDLSDVRVLERAIAGSDIVYHLAGLTRSRGRREFMAVNAAGTANVAHACAAQPRPPVHVLVSSVAAAGPVPRGRIRREGEPPNPVSNYGKSKRASEIAALRYADQVPTTVIRPGIVFGGRDRDMLPIFQTIDRFRIHPIAAIPPRLSMIHVGDLVQVLLAAAERGSRIPRRQPDACPSCGIYFACSHEYPDYAELGRMVAAALDRQPLILLYLIQPVPWLVAGAAEIFSRLQGQLAPLTLDKVREATAESWACSPEAICRDLGFQSQQTISQQLRCTAQWYRANGWL